MSTPNQHQAETARIICQRCGRPVETLMGHFPTCPVPPQQTEFADIKAVALDFIIAAGGEQLPGMVRQAEEFTEALAPTLCERMAQAWDEGMRTGTSRAMRKMSDEPDLPLASASDNPYSPAGGGA